MQLSEQAETSKNVRDYIRQALKEDEQQQKQATQEGKGGASGGTVFPPQDDKFLRVAYRLCQHIKFSNHNDFYDQVYKLSFAKLDADYTQTYPAETYVSDVGILKNSVLPWQPGKVVRSGSGYPFFPSGNGDGATHRIYLNPVPGHATTVYKHVLGLKEILWSKLGDYQVVTTCRDLIVIYVSGTDALGKIKAALQEYQKNNTGHFLDEIPVMTTPLQGLSGVGYAEDLGYLPKDNEVVRYWLEKGEDWRATHPWISEPDTTGIVNLSHSSWRAVFILAALRMSGQGGMDELRKKLTTIAAAAGLAPDTMHTRPKITSTLVSLIADELFPAAEPEADQ
jgi:hypothetical protein